MLTIILMFLLAMYLYRWNRVCSYAVCVLGIFVVLCLPIGGYDRAELVQQSDLAPIVSIGEKKYLEVSNKEIYVYRRQDKSTSEQGVLEATRYDTSVKVVPLQVGETPRMCKYVSSPKCGWFTFAFWSSKTQYVFYVPVDTAKI